MSNRATTTPTHVPSDTPLATHFERFRRQIIGQQQQFESPYGHRSILYADWTASGRLYQPIEDKMAQCFGPFVANTHTETSTTGTMMTLAYHQAKAIIKRHVNASEQDVLISYGSGMTGVINKFQRILNLRLPERWRNSVQLTAQDRPVIFVTHMEHHSNQTSWLETICDLEVIAPTADGLVDLADLERLLKKHADRPHKIAAVTACSNVTGIRTPYHQIAAIMHRHEGLCFVDFACSAPYVAIDMHPADPTERLDAIYFSPHKFLGGPGTAGILIFNSAMYHNRVPDNPGGGTVKWTNPWQEHDYVENIEDREDGGTPPFLQTIRTALCVKLKEEMGIKHILEREEHLVEMVFEELENVPGLQILAQHQRDRLGVFSFIINGLHFNLAVKLLNDRFGIQVRGGCSCAGTYGHYLLEVGQQVSHVLTAQISSGDLSGKPGWVRMSIHPTMTDEELRDLCGAVRSLAEHWREWAIDYIYDRRTNEFSHHSFDDQAAAKVEEWFEM